ncbi:tetratricopeptide repeat domain protein [Calycina marina]|uniref:Tetratricopeptide repeat domain protein n=1 Tax=Calycina marina TaxID=1763456 RepID=A0A9P7YV67_9HELO|nr:tetratricopeptide repeat domain protein [Calycina marina]
MIEAWTDSETGIFWLRDLLPKDVPVARVLTFGYDASASSFYSAGYAETIQKHAHTLVASLQADRSIEGCDHRPIIFICHGLGGVLVKKALAYSASRTSAQVAHLYTIFVSTYGILFFGTPHDCTNTASWLELTSTQSSELRLRTTEPTCSQFNSTLSRNSETLELITDQFAPLMKSFHVFFFWEEVQTSFGHRSGFLVEESSAAPILDNTERSGIDATHSSMVKFSKTNSSSYRTVIEALRRYCREAPRVIAHRCEKALAALARARSNEAFELAGFDFDIHHERLFPGEINTSRRSHNRFFFLPQETAADFIGREDTSDILHNALFLPEITSSISGQSRFVVYGMGGSGKTQLCSQFAKDNQARYWAVFTIRATSVETAKDSFAGIGKIGGFGETEGAGKSWLSQLEERWLLIIDNADNPDLNLADLFPEGDRGHILITTRNPDFRSHGTAGSVELKGLKEQEALHLLLKRADIPRPWDGSTEAAGKEIAQTLGYLALALIQAGTSIYRRICDLKDYLNFHSHYRNQRRARPHSMAIPEDDDIVYSAFDFSMNYLQAKRTIVSQDAVELLNMIAFYHFEHIRVDIFTRAVGNRRRALATAKKFITSRLLGTIITRLQPPPTLPQFLRQDLETLNPYRVRRALHELYSLSLISYDGKDASFSLHPLVHAWARDRLDQREKALWSQIALNTLTESILLPPDDAGEIHAEFRKDLLPHLDACLAACPIRISDYQSLLGRIQLSYAKFFQQTLLFIIRDQTLNAGKCGYVYAERGRFVEATVFLLMVKDALVETLGYENERTMAAMLGLAATYWGLGRLEEAIILQKRVVEARSKAFGPEHRETLLAMDQLGRSYWLHGQYHEALNLQQLTTDRMKTVLGSDHDDTLMALDNLGVTLGSWHRFQESVEIHQQVLLSREKRLGATDLETLSTMHNLAMALLDLKRVDEARGTMQKVYEEREQKLGKEHPWTLWALCTLAKIHIELGLLQEAEYMLVDGIAAGKRSLSENHLGVLMGCGELARVYARQGRFDEAEKLTLDTIWRLEQSRGHEHPDSVYAMWKLAQLYELQEKIEEAVQACEVALERVNLRLTKQHPFGKKIESKLCSLRNRLRPKPEDSLRDEHRQTAQDECHVVRQFKAHSQRTW